MQLLWGSHQEDARLARQPQVSKAVAEQHPRRLRQAHSRLGVESGVAGGLVPVDIEPAGHVG